MKQISVSDVLRKKLNNLKLYCIESDVTVRTADDGLWVQIQETCGRLNASLRLEDISALPAIRASRQAYKTTGKDPARYRLSAEALLRRAVKDKDLYRISNVVDLLNLVSVTSGFSIGGYDADRISGDIVFGIGDKDEPYYGIGRGPLNIEGLPVFRDALGAFGSPTSDSERTSVTENTSRFLMVIIDFGAGELLGKAGTQAEELLIKYADATNMEIKIVE